MLRIPFEWFELAFECFESLSYGWNLDLNASNPFQMVRICIRMLRRIGRNCIRIWISDISLNIFKMVRICIQMLPIPVEWLEFGVELFESFEFAFECFESLLNGSNLISNSANHFRTVRICFQILRMFFKWLEFAFECFESLSNS